MVPVEKPRISFIGQGSRPEDVVLVYNNASGTPKPDGSGSFGTSGERIGPDRRSGLRGQEPDIQQRFRRGRQHVIKDRQAVALHIAADRSVLSNVRCLGNQDTLLVNPPGAASGPGSTSRAATWKATLTSTLRPRGQPLFSAAAGSGPWTVSRHEQRLRVGREPGLVDQVRLPLRPVPAGSDAAANSVHLGRPWHAGGDPEAVAQVLVRDSWLGAHISGAPWTDMSGFSWREARFHEYRNSGPGRTGDR